MTHGIVYILGNGACDAESRRKYADAETVVLNLGHVALSPARLSDVVAPEKRERINLAMIDAADIVVLLPDCYGCKESQEERRYAVEQGKPVERYDGFVSHWIRELAKDK